MFKMLIATILLLLTCSCLLTQGKWCFDLCLETEKCCYSDWGTQTNCCFYADGVCCPDGWSCCPAGYSCDGIDLCVNTTDHTDVLSKTRMRPGAPRDLRDSRVELAKILKKAPEVEDIEAREGKDVI